MQQRQQLLVQALMPSTLSYATRRDEEPLMQFRGFTFGHIEVEVEGRAHDLHNFYAVSAINYVVLERTLTLRFTRHPEDWVPPEEARQITVTFHEVSYLSLIHI